MDMSITEENTLCNSSASTAHIPLQSQHAKVSLCPKPLQAQRSASSMCPCLTTVSFHGSVLLQHSWYGLGQGLRSQPYMSVMSLCLQDPIMEVRHQFAVKVHQMVQDFQKDPTKGHKAAKWAAVFPLAAMDPTQANCQAAFSFLMEFVAVRRWASFLLCHLNTAEAVLVISIWLLQLSTSSCSTPASAQLVSAVVVLCCSQGAKASSASDSTVLQAAI